MAAILRDVTARAEELHRQKIAQRSSPVNCCESVRRPMDRFYTIGHSTRPMDEFAAALREERVRSVIDVRTLPRSRRNPQYNRDVLPATLKAFGVDYMHLSAAGLLASPQPY
jgi:hypothetical protein